MSKAPRSEPNPNLELYAKLVATNPAVERKGKLMPYTSVNGHMFSFISSSGQLALRLPEEAAEAFVKKYDARFCEQHGVVLKEYVVVPDALLKKTRELKKYFDQSYAYVSSLEPKPTRRKKPAPKRRK